MATDPDRIVTEWGVRWQFGAYSHIDNYSDVYLPGEDEAKARYDLRHKARLDGTTATLLRRTVTYSEWKDADA